MSGSDFKIKVEGNQAEAVAAELAELVEKELEYKPAVQKERAPVQDPADPNRGDPVTVAACLFTIPPAIVAAKEMIERMKKRQQADALLQRATEIEQRYPGNQIRIILPEGASLSVKMVNGQTIIDIATEAEKG